MSPGRRREQGAGDDRRTERPAHETPDAHGRLLSRMDDPAASALPFVKNKIRKIRKKNRLICSIKRYDLLSYCIGLPPIFNTLVEIFLGSPVYIESVLTIC